MRIDLIAVPYDSARRGIRMGAGPLRLLESGMAARLALAGHDVASQLVEVGEGTPADEVSGTFALARTLAERVHGSIRRGAFPLVLAGNCSAALGAIAGLERGRTGVFWFDAHGDFNTPRTTTSGFLDGMALAMLTGRCWRRLSASVPGFRPVREPHVLLLGTRDLDPAEAELLQRSSLRVLSPAEVRSRLRPTIEAMDRGIVDAYVHLDLDVLDPEEGRANGFATPGGLRLEEVRSALRLIGERFRIRAATLSAYDPSVDPEGRIVLAAQALGEEIVQRAAAGDPERSVQPTAEPAT